MDLRFWPIHTISIEYHISYIHIENEDSDWPCGEHLLQEVTLDTCISMTGSHLSIVICHPSVIIMSLSNCPELPQDVLIGMSL